jgi:hypothetical protein
MVTFVSTAFGRRLPALAFAVFLLAGPALRAPALADVTGVVRGTVTVDGAPRAGANVTIAGEGTSAQTRTDAHGRFQFPSVAFGRYALTAHVDGRTDTVLTA